MGRIRTPKDDCLAECMLSRALEGMCVGLILTSPSGKVTWMNRAAEGVLGVRLRDGQGRLLGQLLKDPQLAMFWQSAACGETMVVGDVSVRWPAPFELKANCSQCVDPDGQLIGRALMFCDVTRERAVQVELSKAVADRLLEMTGEPVARAEPSSGLTPQEVQVLRMVGHALGNEEIARQISVSVSTVRSHLKSIYRKLGLNSRSEAVNYAVKNGLA